MELTEMEDEFKDFILANFATKGGAEKVIINYLKLLRTEKIIKDAKENIKAVEDINA